MNLYPNKSKRVKYYIAAASNPRLGSWIALNQIIDHQYSHHWIQFLNADLEFCKVYYQICWNPIKSTYTSMLLGPVHLSMVKVYRILICCSLCSQYLGYEISSVAVAGWNQYSSAMLCETTAIWMVSHLCLTEYKYNLTPISEWTTNGGWWSGPCSW